MADETKEIVENKVRKIKNMILRVEIVIGVIAMIFGIGLTVLVWGEGFFPGALMLIMTGLINIFLAVKELLDPTDGIFHWQPLFFMIVRRAMFFLNVVLTALVFGTMTQLLG
ncbi:MAG: hypothetical protein IKB43_12215 [Fibrobacter sp.]|nr:hypothetical protein [Fibrobacter sp.]MBR2470887.1 hypothetical protein [Fibrobacter sp.]